MCARGAAQAIRERDPTTRCTATLTAGNWNWNASRAQPPAAPCTWAGRTARRAVSHFRLALRDRLLILQHANVARSGRTRPAPSRCWQVADTTYLQPRAGAGHYLGGFAEQAMRHLDRIEAAYRAPRLLPPAETGRRGGRDPAAAGPGRLARSLGFGAVGPHTRDAMWSADAADAVLLAAAQAVTTISQLASCFASPAFGYVTLDASLCRASVLMHRTEPVRAARAGGAGHAGRPPDRAAGDGAHPVGADRRLAVRLRRGGGSP